MRKRDKTVGWFKTNPITDLNMTTNSVPTFVKNCFPETSNIYLVDLGMNRSFYHSILYCLDSNYQSLTPKLKEELVLYFCFVLGNDLDGNTNLFTKNGYRKLRWNRVKMKKGLHRDTYLDITNIGAMNIIAYICDYLNINIILFEKVTGKILFTTRGKYPDIYYTSQLPIIYLAVDKKTHIFSPIVVDNQTLFSQMHPVLINKLNSKELQKPVYNEQKEKSVYKQNINELTTTAKDLGIALDKETEDSVLKKKTVLELRNEIRQKLNSVSV